MNTFEIFAMNTLILISETTICSTSKVFYIAAILLMNRYNILFYLPVSQYFPVNPGLHVHCNEPVRRVVLA